MSIVAPTRIEPARIEDPSEKLRLKCVALSDAAAALLDIVPMAVRADVARDISMVSAYHSSRIERRSPPMEDLLMPGPARTEMMHECIALAGMHASVSTSGPGYDLDPSSEEWLLSRHAELSGQAPWMAGADRPGALRDLDVCVGAHLPPPAECIPAFMDYFFRRYRQDWLHGDVARILAAATSHHRLSYIHPFMDGNGRIGRLHTHAMLHRCGIAAEGLWSLPRALSCSEGGIETYHRMMALGDRPRQGDRDGRGNLSLAALESFSMWFVDACCNEIMQTARLLSSLDCSASASQYNDGKSRIDFLGFMMGL